MKILIVEDDENKGESLRQFVRTLFPNAELELCRSLRSGIKSMRANRPALILLDMTLPNYDVGPNEHGMTPHIFGGQEFLKEMDRFDIFSPVIVVTQFEHFGEEPSKTLVDLNDELRRQFEKVYIGALLTFAASIVRTLDCFTLKVSGSSALHLINVRRELISPGVIDMRCRASFWPAA
jgi:CheY-like chemotaxis protein